MSRMSKKEYLQRKRAVALEIAGILDEMTGKYSVSQLANDTLITAIGLWLINQNTFVDDQKRGMDYLAAQVKILLNQWEREREEARRIAVEQGI